MQVEQLFRLASSHFEDNEYEKGLELMSQCIARSPHSSALYSNRALFHSQLGHIEAAVQDLGEAIRRNHLNYVAYFNLFSLQFNAGQPLPAFDNLCASLSCLHLLRARNSRRELDLQRAIKYADNNPEAHILKALLYLQEGKLRHSLNEVEWAIDIRVHAPLCLQLRNLLTRRLNPYAVSEIEEPLPPPPDFRLRTTCELPADYEEEVRARVQEFNEIYDEIVNSQYGTVTQKVPRLRLDNDSNAHSRSRLIADISEIYEVRFHPRQSAEKGSEAPTKEHLPSDSSRSDLRQQEDTEQPALEKEDNLLDDEPTTSQQKVELPERESSEELGKKEAAQEELLIDTTQQKPAVPAPAVQESVSLYPLAERRKIQFTIVSAEVKAAGKLRDLYLTGNYNSRKGQRLKTPIKKLEGNIVRWNTTVAATPAAETMQTVEVRLLSRHEDELLGEGEVEVLATGEMKFPVYFKHKVTALVTLRVDLV